MDDYLSKPLDSGQLVRTLRKWVSRKPRTGSNRKQERAAGAVSLDSGEVREGDVPEPAEMAPLFVELAGLLKENNLKTGACLKGIKKHLVNTRLHKTMARLEHQIIELDYEHALGTLNRIGDVLGIALEEI